MSRRAKASYQAIGAFAGFTALAGSGIGGAAYLSGTALAGGGITSLNITTTAFRPLASLSLNGLKGIIQGRATQLLREFFKTGKLPEGLTRQALEVYREIAKRTIEEGRDTIGVQAVRLKLIEKVLETLK